MYMCTREQTLQRKNCIVYMNVIEMLVYHLLGNIL